jgi:predicted lipid-binding transport protein (Tim44 family)
MAARRGSTQDKPKTRSDAYVGLLFISLLAMIVAAVFFFLDYNQYPSVKPPEPPKVSAPAPAPQPGGAAPAPGGGAAGMGGGGMAGMGGGMAGMGGGGNK